MDEMTVSVELVCPSCGEGMYTTGSRGLCPQCLLATTSGVSTPTPGAASDADGSEFLVYGAMVGAGERFLLLDKLGQGGMGEVWLAKDQELSRPGADHLVALKFISPAVRHDARALASIREEVLSSQALSHPNIVRIFDLHVTHHGMPFIKMEYVEGNSLGHWLKQVPGGVMPWPMVSELAHQLAGALRYAHESVGIIHRDLKPGNLLLSKGRVLKLSDFGIAATLTAEGAGKSVGTPLYASPQQLAGAAPTPADDIYSLGATLYELLTGTPPFTAKTAAELLHRIQNEAPEPIPQRLARLGRENRVPAKMLLLVHRCLEKDPAYRPKTLELEHLLPTMLQAPANPAWSRSAVDASAGTTAAAGSGWSSWLGTILLLAAMAAALALATDYHQVRTRLVAAWGKTPAHPLPAAPRTDGVPPITSPGTAHGREAMSRPAEAKLSAAPEPPPGAMGQVRIEIRSAQSAPLPHGITISNHATGALVVTNDFLTEKELVYARNLPPGKYLATVTERDGQKDNPWEFPVELEVQAGKTN